MNTVSKKESRLRRAKRTRMRIKELRVNRLVVFRSLNHIYAQITSFDGAKTFLSASSAEEALSKGLGGRTGNIDAAKLVGKAIAERALSHGITSVAYDRSGFLYHGRVKALADAAREAGLQF